MAIAQIEFGKNLRPTTVELVKKVNETITAINSLDPSLVEQLITDVNTLKQSTAATDKKVQANTTNITSLQATQQEHTTDIDKMKVTLYTPLAEADTDKASR